MQAERDNEKEGTWIIADNDGDEAMIKELANNRYNELRPIAVFIPDRKPGIVQKIFRRPARPADVPTEEVQPADDSAVIPPVPQDLPPSSMPPITYDREILQDMQLYELRDLAVAARILYADFDTREQIIEALLGESR